MVVLGWISQRSPTSQRRPTKTRAWSTVAALNPILYMVEGLRYGLLGVSSLSPWAGVAVTAPLAAASLALAYAMLARGYKLRS